MMRRELGVAALALAAGLLTKRSGAKQLSSAELELSELSLPGNRAFGRALLLVPRSLPREPELLVLLHGLGETHDQVVGMRAFAERYGLLSAVSRLSQPPLARSLAGKDYFGAGRLEELNARLARRPFRCPVLLCPFTPNPYNAGGDPMLRRYGDFVCGPLKSEVEQRLGVSFSSPRCMLSGVSLGGYIALELFLQKPDVFCAVGLAQGAFGQNQAARYAKSFKTAAERVGARRAEILSSSFDPYRRPNELLHQHLQRLQQPSRLRVSPGPHDQSWLKESGVIEMLLSADDVFAEQREQRRQ